METIEIQESFKNAMCDQDYLNFFTNKLLFEGKSNIVFQDEMLRRIKVAYYGRMCNDGKSFYNSYQIDGNKVRYGTSNLNDFFKNNISFLICSNDIHSVATNVLTDLAFNDGLKWSIGDDSEESQEEVEKFIEDNELQELMIDSFRLVHYSGGLLAKIIISGTEKNKEYSIDYITNQNYFPVKSAINARNTIGYVEYQKVSKDKEDEIYLITEHTKNKTEKYFATLDKKQGEIQRLDSQVEWMNKFGLEKQDLLIQHDDWLVREIYENKGYNKCYGNSFYSYSSKQNLADWTAIATVETQNIDSIMSVKYVISDEFVEMSDGDNPYPIVQQASQYFIAQQVS